MACVIIYAINYGLGVVGPKNGHGFRFHKVELMLGERAAHGHPTAQFGTIKKSPVLRVGPRMSMCYLHEICLK